MEQNDHDRVERLTAELKDAKDMLDAVNRDADRLARRALQLEDFIRLLSRYSRCQRGSRVPSCLPGTEEMP